MAEPALNLHGVPALIEQERCAGVPERMPARPWCARFLGRRLEHPSAQVAVMHWPAVARAEHKVIVTRPLTRLACLPQIYHERVSERNVATPILRLRRHKTALDVGAPDAHGGVGAAK